MGSPLPRWKLIPGSVQFNVSADPLVALLDKIGIVDAHRDGIVWTDGGTAPAGTAVLAHYRPITNNLYGLHVTMIYAFAAALAIVSDRDGDTVKTGKHRPDEFHGGVTRIADDTAAFTTEADGEQFSTILDAEDEIVYPGLPHHRHQSGLRRT